MERLVTSKLRAELQWGVPTLAQLGVHSASASKNLALSGSEPMSIVHRLEGLIWALEQRVGQQERQLIELREAVATRDAMLAECERADQRSLEEGRMVVAALIRSPPPNDVLEHLRDRNWAENRDPACLKLACLQSVRRGDRILDGTFELRARQ